MNLTSFLRKYVLPETPYLLFWWFFWKMSAGYPFLPYPDWLIGLAGAVIVRVIVLYKKLNAKKYRQGVEYGSARWGVYY